MKNYKTINLISTGLLTLLMLFSAGMYFFQNEQIVGAFTKLGYPTYLIYPLAILKLLGLIAIWTKMSKSLTEWAYAGFFFDVILALTAHLMIGDGEFQPASLALVLVLVSYFSYKKMID